MKAILIMVGTELLNGGFIDTNSIFIGEELNKYGIEIESKIVVRDFKHEIIKGLEYAKKNAELVIVSGGMGPTLDDITKESIADFFNKPLIIDEIERCEFVEKFKRRDTNYKIVNYKEVEKPEGAISFSNDVGMANGIFVEGIAVFPGVPRELYNIFPKFLKWYRENHMHNIDEIYIKDLITVGVPESHLEERVKKYFLSDDVYYEFLVKDYGTLIRLQSRLSHKKVVEKIIENLYNELGNSIYGEDEERLETLLIKKLKEKGMDISVAESCSGGLLSSRIVSVSGASEVFKEGLVTYSNISKMKNLNVKESSLKKYGAVSEEVAKEMAKGLDTDFGISITGIAGPNGGTDKKPVGLVYIGFKIKDEVIAKRFIFRGNRDKIREKSVLQALYESVTILRNS